MRVEGRRYNAETLAVEYRGKFDRRRIGHAHAAKQRSDCLTNIPKIRRYLCKHSVDHGARIISRWANRPRRLSGGEAQRVKLSAELSASTIRGKTLYLLDEPTTGLALRRHLAKLL